MVEPMDVMNASLQLFNYVIGPLLLFCALMLADNIIQFIMGLFKDKKIRFN